MIAKNIIEDDESAVVISTDGTNFKIFDGGFATIGNWVIDRDLSVDKAIIYKRDKVNNRIEVFLGKPLDVFPSKMFRRYVVRLFDFNYVGTTEYNWQEFTESKRGATNPIKYINKNRIKNRKNSLLSLS
ncbi:MAG TPA: hypothetical protein VK308_08535 [Pyrinomonadaceae bacterium]|jgi:hypothetical protein|nr:hypothetical protein [Pyrinomonadaceae bacterium]